MTAPAFAVERAAARLRLAPGLFFDDPVLAADAGTTRADCRIALAAARRIDLDQICPASGRRMEET